MFSLPRSSSRFRMFLGAAVLCLAAGSARAQDAPAALTLDQCIDLGLQRQPALHAAQASLSAAAIGSDSLQRMRFAGLFSRDIPIRRQQACLGITIQSAQLQTVEWETRYAIVRNYYSVIYARTQHELVKDVVRNLTEARDTAKKLVEKGAGAIKLTQLDVDALTVNLDLVRIKEAEAVAGVAKATAALREAIGIGPEYPLAVADSLLPGPVAKLDKEALISAAVANRGEMTMASAASEVTNLEITAQSRLLFKLQVPTFAYGSDIHAKPIPTGVANGEYRPGAIGLEMPPALIGHRGDRMDRAAAFYDRSLAVVDKTQNLIALEVEVTYLKWQENLDKIASLERALKLSTDLARNVQKRFNEGNTTGEEYLRARGLVDQTRAWLNEAIYNHALALAGLERTTAGAYRMPRDGK
ncbi:MAG: TolC family protein [Gemmataceae bacterium]